MPVSFVVKVKHQGRPTINSYIKESAGNKKSYTKQKVVTEIITGAIEEDILDLTGKMIVTKGIEASLRYLKLMAIFFQRVVSRTPFDEDYVKGFSSRNDKPIVHYADDDYIRDYWTISYGKNKPITAKYLIDNCGCTFVKFNDQNEIDIIYKELQRFLGKQGSLLRTGGRTIHGVHLENTHPDKKRYAMLEYGMYSKNDSRIKKDSDNLRPHGLRGAYSIQAPAGMYRITEAEMKQGNFNVSTERLGKNQVRLQRIKTKAQLRELNKYLSEKKKLTVSDIGEIARLYGL